MRAVAGAGYFVRFFGGGWATAVQVTVVFAATLALAVLAFSRTVRARLRVFINKHFYAYRYDYREEWLKFTNFLSNAADDGDMVTRSIHALADLVESPGGAQWWRDERGDFRQSGRWNMPADLPTIPADDPFIGFLARTGWVVDVQDFMRRRDAYPGMEPPDWLLSLGNAWIVIPLPVADGLGGLVVLTKPRTPVELNWEVLDLLKTAAKQAASVISQVRLAEALVEAQQFSAFNRMSAFVVHDLKNLVAQLSLMLKNAERHSANPEFQKDMRSTIEHVVDRMTRLLLQLRSGAAPIGNPTPVDIGAVMARIRTSCARQGREVVLDVTGGVWAMAHEERIERVLGHLVQNAFDAMEGRGAVTVRIATEGSHAVAEVEDKGKGMSSEFIREQLFKPFRSTKSTGMGIGAYESQQYVSELGGRIAVESRVGVGTRMKVILPARSRDIASDESRAEAA
jgi:putative PEP-CTERM system histidine kinase